MPPTITRLLLAGALCALSSCRSTPPQDTREDSPQACFAQLQNCLRKEDHRSLFELLSSETQQQLATALESPSNASHWRERGLDPQELLQLPAPKAFAQVFEQERALNPAIYQSLAATQLTQVSPRESDTEVELRCVHPETHKIQFLVLRQEQGAWRIHELFP